MLKRNKHLLAPVPKEGRRMKLFLLFTGFALSASAQQLTYNQELVDTVKISSTYAFYHFDEARTNSRLSDEYVIFYNKEKNHYIPGVHKRINYKYTRSSNKEVTKEIQARTFDPSDTSFKRIKAV